MRFYRTILKSQNFISLPLIDLFGGSDNGDWIQDGFSSLLLRYLVVFPILFAKGKIVQVVQLCCYVYHGLHSDPIRFTHRSASRTLYW